jgi:imidazole glycerol-phosphate synthase subunit HisF
MTETTGSSVIAYLMHTPDHQAHEEAVPGCTVRLIARLDLKMDFLIKGVQFEGWRKVGIPGDFARQYYADGVDELIYIDVVASLYERNNLTDIIREAAQDVLIPITVGGGIRTVADVKALLSVGADKVAINTAATNDPELLTAVSETYGSQATVLSIEAMRKPGDGWEAMTDNGRNHTGRDVVAWAIEGTRRGAGEILLTSIDRDGTGRGMDIDLIAAVTGAVDVPVIASGGAGRPEHLVEAIIGGGASAVAVAKALHYRQFSVAEARAALRSSGVRVRTLEEV